MTGEQRKLYEAAGEQFAPAIARLARAMERDADKARDLEQDIHCELWRSFARFDGRCSLSTWVYRVAHNVAADYVTRAAKLPAPTPLHEIEQLPGDDAESAAADQHAITRIHALIRLLPTLDAQVILLWLEGLNGAEIAQVTGLSANAVSVRVHRIKSLLSAEFSMSVEGAS
jgi:RNA polymerase sigma-70 factor (ECF subfamily)